VACYLALFSALAHAARRRGDMRSYTAWKTYQNGLISAPIWCVVTLFIARDGMGCSEESLGMITSVGGVTQGLFASFFMCSLLWGLVARTVRLSRIVKVGINKLVIECRDV
jgi:hypothetical protein